ncbi:hypothetical protein C8R47DRAFT_1083527 [Mycena vitilis]|nr:hypothetical protein C8R47DRAFT_1083527 [Mycena vitilis]
MASANKNSTDQINVTLNPNTMDEEGPAYNDNNLVDISLSLELWLLLLRKFWQEVGRPTEPAKPTEEEEIALPEPVDSMRRIFEQWELKDDNGAAEVLVELQHGEERASAENDVAPSQEHTHTAGFRVKKVVQDQNPLVKYAVEDIICAGVVHPVTQPARPPSQLPLQHRIGGFPLTSGDQVEISCSAASHSGWRLPIDKRRPVIPTRTTAITGCSAASHSGWRLPIDKRRPVTYSNPHDRHHRFLCSIAFGLAAKLPIDRQRYIVPTWSTDFQPHVWGRSLFPLRHRQQEVLLKGQSGARACALLNSLDGLPPISRPITAEGAKTPEAPRYQILRQLDRAQRTITGPNHGTPRAAHGNEPRSSPVDDASVSSAPVSPFEPSGSTASTDPLSLFDPECQQFPHPMYMSHFIHLFFENAGEEFPFMDYQKVSTDFMQRNLPALLANCIACIGARYSVFFGLTVPAYVDTAKPLLILAVSGLHAYREMAMNMARELGLHNQRDSSIDMSESESECRRRRSTWESVLQLHLTASADRHASILLTVFYGQAQPNNDVEHPRWTPPIGSSAFKTPYILNHLQYAVRRCVTCVPITVAPQSRVDVVWPRYRSIVPQHTVHVVAVLKLHLDCKKHKHEFLPGNATAPHPKYCAIVRVSTGKKLP